MRSIINHIRQSLSSRHIRNLGGSLTLDTSYVGGCRFVIEVPIG